MSNIEEVLLGFMLVVLVVGDKGNRTLKVEKKLLVFNALLLLVPLIEETFNRLLLLEEEAVVVGLSKKDLAKKDPSPYSFTNKVW